MFSIFEKYCQILWKSALSEPSCSTQTDGRIDRQTASQAYKYDETNSRTPQFCERA